MTKRTFFLLQLFISAVLVLSQPPRNGGRTQITCPSDGSYAGDSTYIGNGPKAAPLRGTIGCVGSDTITPFTDKLLIYGPFEAGFSNDQLSQFFGCSSSTASIPGGIDTLVAEKMAAYECGLDESAVSILDDCGGHATPYHYHEKMGCLYSADPSTQHSTRIGTALDGNGIYGKYIDGGVAPTDLDACGGRYGITPDSNGKTVYYYVVQDVAPFTVGCFGPVSSVDECRALYSSCGDGDEMTITTASGTMQYDPDCPCFDKDNGMSNVVGSNSGTSGESESPIDGNTPNLRHNASSALNVIFCLSLPFLAMFFLL